MASSPALGVHVPTGSPQTNTGENFHTLEVMSPSTMAYLHNVLEVISADINNAEDMERSRKNSGARVGHLSGGRPSVHLQSPNGNQHLPVSAESSLAEFTSPQPTVPHYSPVSDVTQSPVTTATTLVDVTNNQDLLNLDDHNSNTNKPQQTPPRKRVTSQRKRTINEDEDNEEDTGVQRLKKKSRISTSEENFTQQPATRRPSSCSVTSPLSTSPLELSTAVVSPTVKAADDANTPRVDSDKGTTKKSRSRRFKEDELVFLDAVFKTDPYPDPMITERLSIQLDVSENRIKVWFANRRHRQARDREQKITNMPEKKDQLVTETAAVPSENNNTSSALPNNTSSALPSSPSFMPHYGMVPSGYSYIHPSTIPSAIPKHKPDFNVSKEACLRAQIASIIQTRFPFSSPALLQLANQTMLARAGLNPCHQPMGYSVPSSGDTCDLARLPKRRPSSSYYVEPPILPPLTAESTSYTDGVSLSPAIDDSPSPWHWLP